jgi:hypothetical protein
MSSNVSSLLNGSKAVDELISRLPDSVKKLTEKIRELIISSSGQITEHVRHNLPFYYYKGQLCYINPLDDKVVLVFSRGADLPDEYRMLKGNQKTHRYLIFYISDGIDETKVRNLIYEALIINELKDRTRKSKE